MRGPAATTLRRGLLAAAALVLVALVLVGVSHAAVAGLGAASAYLLPPLLLVVLLLLRGYPGERVLLGVVRKRDRMLRRRCMPGFSNLPRPRVLLARGGRLIASSLAVRPPPAPVVALP